MRFATIFSLGLLSVASALPTTLNARQDPGPSGSVISPAGDSEYKVGDLIHFQYQRARTDIAQTSSVEIRLLSFDGKVTYNANNITLVSWLASPDDADTIDAYLRVPPHVAGYDNPSQTSWVDHLEVYETQVGSLGAAPFLAAAPRLVITA